MRPSRSMKVTTHFPTDTSAPTYMNSATAKSRNDGLRKRLPASLMLNDSACTGPGNFAETTISIKTIEATPSTQKISPRPPRCCRLCTTRGREASPSPKQMSSRFSAEFRQAEATSATRACPAATIALAPSPSTREQAKIRNSAEAAATLVTVS